MNQMNMAGMNPGAAGAAAVGGIPMMNTGSSSAPRSDNSNHSNPDAMGGPVVQLNTYIYDYFLKKGYHDCARALVQESVPLHTTKAPRRDTEVNGVDSEMGDSKDEVKKIPDDLPRPALTGDSHSSFLFEWWSLFWDIWAAQRRKGKSPDAMHYLQYAQVSHACRIRRRVSFD